MDGEFEDTELYKLISRSTKQSCLDAWRLIGKLPEEEVRRRSNQDRSTYLHHVVNSASVLYARCQDLTVLVPVIYRLAVKGVNVNAQNEHGNTCLHLACIRPHAEALCSHLIRIGADPCVQNKKQCRVIHTYRGHQCVLVKGQTSAKSGLWNAVEKEDLATVEKLLRSWCRVCVRRNKTLKAIAEETANVQLIKMLSRYEETNELACNALACDVDNVRDILKAGKADLQLRDEACDVAKPLAVAVAEMGQLGQPVVTLLKQYGANGSSEYENRRQKQEQAFENSAFYQKITSGSPEDLEEALAAIQKDEFDICLVSHQADTLGWTYLHLLVGRYVAMKQEDEEKARLLIRAIYRLALAGIDVNARDHKGETALIKSASSLDQNLMTHLIRLGADPFLADTSGRAVNEEVYQDKGKLVFDNKYRMTDLPGLWVAVHQNEIAKAERWLKSWARVNCRKGDRRLLDVARALGHKEIVRLLEEYEHINEFVCATFACDLKRMMDILALGKGKNKVNTIDDFFHVGYTWDRHAEFMPRPIVIAAMELCTPEVVDFLLNFGADLNKEHEENAPCGPVAFWAFRNHVNNKNALVVAKHADVELRDELGATMLHRAVQKERAEGKAEILASLLDRGINVAACDHEGSTARDYIAIHGVQYGDILRQMIDNHVLELVTNDQHYKLETLLLESYDHVTDIRGTKRHKNAREIAEMKEFKDCILLFDEWEAYKSEIELLHESARKGDLMTIAKLSGEKRCAWSKDKAGRTLLHNAVLFERPDVVRFLVEQFPNLITSRDNLNRTPLHLCVCLKQRHLVWPTLQDGGSDPNLVDANNMSVYDYVRELETPTPTRYKSRGRRWRDYRPHEVVEYERTKEYGAKAARYELQRQLLPIICSEVLATVKTVTKNFTGDLSKDDLDIALLKLCIEHKRSEVAKHLITCCGARAHVSFALGDEPSASRKTLKQHAKTAGLSDLADFIRSRPKPEDPDVQEQSRDAN